MRHYADQGFPAGPFTDPTVVYVAVSGRGKIHVNAHCRPGLTGTRRRLWGTSLDAFCTRCVRNELSLPHADYLMTLSELLDLHLAMLGISANTHCLAADAWRTDGADKVDRLQRQWVLVTVTRHRVAELRATSSSDVAAWIDEHLTPAVDDALATLHQALPVLADHGWRARLTAATVLDQTATPSGPAIRYRHPLTTVRHALHYAWFTQPVLDPAALREVAAEAAELALTRGQDTLEKLSQLPDDLIAGNPLPGEPITEYLHRQWRSAALVELDRYAQSLIAELMERYEADQHAGDTMIEVLGFDRTVAREDFITALVLTADRLHVNTEDRTATAVVPAPLAYYIRTRCAETVDIYGAAEDSDTDYLYQVARMLKSSMKPAEALTMARITALQANAFVTA